MAAVCVCGREAKKRLVYDKPAKRSGLARTISPPYCTRCLDKRAFGALYSASVRFINAPLVSR